jgi:tRNA(adenine34) deaminase
MTDRFYMEIALKEAAGGERSGEVPVGAVLVDGKGRIVARACNSPIAASDPSAHAEINVLRKAGKRMGNYRLSGCTLYVTIEPCPMCAGAMVHARIRRVVFGAPDLKAGACGTVMDIAGHARLNHGIEVTGGILEERCAELLRGFFRKKRGRSGKGCGAVTGCN